jgi:hypothetical protein
MVSFFFVLFCEKGGCGLGLIWGCYILFGSFFCLFGWIESWDCGSSGANPLDARPAALLATWRPWDWEGVLYA